MDIAGDGRAGKVRKQHAILDRYDLGESGEAEQGLSFEKVIVVVFSNLLDDSFDEALDVEGSSLF